MYIYMACNTLLTAVQYFYHYAYFHYLLQWKIVALNDLDLEGLKPVASHTSDIRNYFCYDDKHKKFLYICFYLVPSN